MALADWLIEPLNKGHDRKAFDCGEPALNDFLRRYARQHQGPGLSRTFVARPVQEARPVWGYYSLAAGAIDRANLPVAAAGAFPRFPLPVVRLVRLAVNRPQQGHGLGEDLLVDALHRTLDVAQAIGVVGMVVEAKHAKARRFYERFEFESFPDHPLTLWLPLAAIEKLLG